MAKSSKMLLLTLSKLRQLFRTQAEALHLLEIRKAQKSRDITLIWGGFNAHRHGFSRSTFGAALLNC